MDRDLSFERAIQFAADIIRIPSLSGQEGAVAQRIVEEMRALGFDQAGTDRAGNVVGLIEGTGHASPIVLSTHMDIVDVDDPATWEYGPWSGAIADGCLHGRGAMDVKGPLALQVYAAARFVHERPAGDLRVVCSVYEEKGGWGMMHHMDTCEVRPGAVILGEATGGDLCTGHRGHAELAVEIQGLAAHAGSPERGFNPNHALPYVMLAVGELSAGQPRHPVLGAATLTPTVVESWPKSGNVVPDRIRITLDWRVLPGWDEDQALAQLRTLLAQRVPRIPGLHVEVVPGRATHRAWTGWVDEHSNFTPGFLLENDHPVVRAAARAVYMATGRVPALRQWKFGTDGGHTCGTHGVPTIGYAPGLEGLAHTSRERLDLRAARVAFDAYPTLIRAVHGALTNVRIIPVERIRPAAAPLEAAEAESAAPLTLLRPEPAAPLTAVPAEPVFAGLESAVPLKLVRPDPLHDEAEPATPLFAEAEPAAQFLFAEMEPAPLTLVRAEHAAIEFGEAEPAAQFLLAEMEPAPLTLVRPEPGAIEFGEAEAGAPFLFAGAEHAAPLVLVRGEPAAPLVLVEPEPAAPFLFVQAQDAAPPLYVEADPALPLTLAEAEPAGVGP